MPGVHCEICGGNLVAAPKSTMFVCSHCGIQYPKNKVRRMFFKDAGVDSNAPLSTDEIKRLHALVKKYFKEENFVDAEKTTNRILAADPEDQVGNAYFDILCKMKIDFKVERGTLIKYIGKDTVVQIPKLVTAIGNSAFEGNTEVTKIIVPQGVKSLGHHAFNGCKNLETISLPSSLTFVGYNAFMDCESLTTVALPDSLSFLGDYAFYNCRALTTVNIPAKLTTIGRKTFAFCQQLKNIQITPRITSIGVGAFEGCSTLTTIGDVTKVPFIGENAFRGCDQLAKVTVKEPRFMSNGWEKYCQENR